MESLRLPLPQSPEYARTLGSLGIALRSGSETGLAWQIQSRRLPVLGPVDLLSRGPVARDPADLYPALARCRRPGVPLLLNADGIGAEALRAGGFWPLMTPATLALLPLGPEDTMRAAMHQKWRNTLNRSARQGLTLSRQSLSGTHWLLEAEARQASARRYRALPPGLIAAFARANPGKALIWEARHRGSPVAAIAVLRHGRMASWQIGVTLDEGRRRGAMNALLWEAMRWLAGHGHDQLDLGMLNSDDAPGLTRFKLRSGASAHRLGGTWLHMGALAPLARHLPAGLAA
ncbi:GNAT family N-acetyltransferase [Salipiger abyssi]|uniref:GNAT family N-acetyltransferase n=1 Tax=Salipiger abyssi TaxID=1250539 RepID=UPI001A8E1659|nr:GNAT family N-acetyltransferase [Salipiger abyssi]MBN9887595.1 GNAT family N-acetyltransferase [Salipiger abyssi]